VHGDVSSIVLVCANTGGPAIALQLQNTRIDWSVRWTSVAVDIGRAQSDSSVAFASRSAISLYDRYTPRPLAIFPQPFFPYFFSSFFFFSLFFFFGGFVIPPPVCRMSPTLHTPSLGHPTIGPYSVFRFPFGFHDRFCV